MSTEQVVTAASLEETNALAARIAMGCRALIASGRPSILIGLSGDLGAGKTAFVQGFVRALAPDEEHFVTSPTFAIVQEYRTTPPVTHMDLYRLGALADLEAIGYRDHYFAFGVALVEWIDRVPEAIPPEWIEINLAVQPTDVREIRVFAHGNSLAGLIEKALK